MRVVRDLVIESVLRFIFDLLGEKTVFFLDQIIFVCDLLCQIRNVAVEAIQGGDVLTPCDASAFELYGLANEVSISRGIDVISRTVYCFSVSAFHFRIDMCDLKEPVVARV